MDLAGNHYSRCKENENPAKVWKMEFAKRCVAKGFDIRGAYDFVEEIVLINLIFE